MDALYWCVTWSRAQPQQPTDAEIEREFRTFFTKREQLALSIWNAPTPERRPMRRLR